MRMVYTPVYCISWHNTIIEQSAAPLPSVSRICRVRLFNVVQIATTPEASDRGPRSDVQGACVCVCVCVCVGSWRHTSTRLSRASRLSQQLNCNMYSCFSTITCLLFLDYHNNPTATCIVVLRVSLKDLQRCSIPNNVYALIAWPTQITQERE